MRRGRGGRAVALSATATGARQTGHQRSKQSRGQTSAQHRYLATRFARTLSGAQLEANLDGKSVDVLLPYNGEQHERFVSVISELACRHVALNGGDLVAIEIETTTDGATNATKNRAAGVALTIIATTDPVRHMALNASDVIVLDAFVLLEALR